jgi:hypothetical protein
MRFMLQVYFHDAQERLRRLPADEREAVVTEYRTFFRSPEVRDGNQLQPPATAITVRVQNGGLALEAGPFAAPAEPLGGYYLVETSDIEAAVALAVRIPAVRMGGAVEVRPVIER